MKIIRWLLSHSLFILLIVAVIYAYMFWGNLLGEDTPAGKAVAYLSTEFVEVEEFVNAIKTRQAQLSEEKSSEQHSFKPEIDKTASTTDTDKAPQQVGLIEPESVAPESIATEAVAVEHKTEVATSPVESIEPESTKPKSIEPESIELELVATEEVVVDQKTEVTSNPVEPLPVIKQPMVEQAVLEQPVIEQPVIEQQQVNIRYNQHAAFDNKDKVDAMAATHSDTEETFVSAEVAKQLDNVDQHGEVIDASQPGGAIREKWITARKSFYQRDYELSEKSYRQVIDSTKDNYDAYGELGNVYFNQGKNKQAASVYFEAAAILVGKGEIYRARSLMGLLRSLDKSKAEELGKLIDLTKS